MTDTVSDIQTEPLILNAETDLSQVDDLGSVVDQLVSEIDQTIQEIEHSKVDPDAESPTSNEVLASDAAIEDSGQSVQAAPKPEAEPIVSEDDTEMETQVEQMIDEAASSEEEPESDDISDSDLGVTQESIEALDQKLAQNAEAEIAGDFETLDGEFETFEVPAEESPAVDVVEDSPPAASADKVEASPEPAAPAAQAPGNIEDTAVPTPEIASASVGSRSLLDRVRGLAGQPAARRATQVVRLAGRPVVDVMSIPMRKVEPRIRDTVGWIAINTAFIAVCVWLFLLLR
jgi:hypothetical protein